MGEGVLGPGYWVLGSKSWVLGPKSWVLGLGSWILGPGPGSWVLGPGSWVLCSAGQIAILGVWGGGFLGRGGMPYWHRHPIYSTADYKCNSTECIDHRSMYL